MTIATRASGTQSSPSLRLHIFSLERGIHPPCDPCQSLCCSHFYWKGCSSFFGSAFHQLHPTTHFCWKRYSSPFGALLFYSRCHALFHWNEVFVTLLHLIFTNHYIVPALIRNGIHFAFAPDPVNCAVAHTFPKYSIYRTFALYSVNSTVAHTFIKKVSTTPSPIIMKTALSHTLSGILRLQVHSYWNGRQSSCLTTHCDLHRFAFLHQTVTVAQTTADPTYASHRGILHLMNY